MEKMSRKRGSKNHKKKKKKKSPKFDATFLLGDIPHLIHGSWAFLVSKEATRSVCQCYV